MHNVNCWESKFEPCECSNKLFDLIESLNKRVKIPVDVQTIKKASYYACVYHGSQIRESGDPYYYHPLEVAYLFAEYSGKKDWRYYTTDLIVIAILHDCLEDTKLTYEMIKTIFSKDVADGVQDLTRIKDGVKYEAYKTLDSLYVQGKIGLLYVKLFDRLHNAMTLDPMSREKQIKIAGETYDHFIIYAECLELEGLNKELINICSKYLPIKANLLQPQEQNHFSFALGDSQILSLAFRNEEGQKHSQ